VRKGSQEGRAGPRRRGGGEKEREASHRFQNGRKEEEKWGKPSKGGEGPKEGGRVAGRAEWRGSRTRRGKKKSDRDVGAGRAREMQRAGQGKREERSEKKSEMRKGGNGRGTGKARREKVMSREGKQATRRVRGGKTRTGVKKERRKEAKRSRRAGTKKKRGGSRSRGKTTARKAEARGEEEGEGRRPVKTCPRRRRRTPAGKPQNGEEGDAAQAKGGRLGAGGEKRTDQKRPARPGRIKPNGRKTSGKRSGGATGRAAGQAGARAAGRTRATGAAVKRGAGRQGSTGRTERATGDRGKALGGAQGRGSKKARQGRRKKRWDGGQERPPEAAGPSMRHRDRTYGSHENKCTAGEKSAGAAGPPSRREGEAAEGKEVAGEPREEKAKERRRRVPGGNKRGRRRASERRSERGAENRKMRGGPAMADTRSMVGAGATERGRRGEKSSGQRRAGTDARKGAPSG